MDLTPNEIIYGDDGYTGDVYDPDSVTRFADADYYRDKIREFQQTLNAVDSAARALQRVYEIPGLSEEIWYEALTSLQEYDGKRTQFVLAAEALNAASAAANAAGFRMPVLSIPQTLQAAPLAIAALGGAVAGAAALITWGVTWIQGAQATAQRIAMLETLSPEDRATAVAAALEIEKAQAQALSPVVAVAGAVKWIALGVAVFFGWKAYQQYARG